MLNIVSYSASMIWWIMGCHLFWYSNRLNIRKRRCATILVSQSKHLYVNVCLLCRNCHTVHVLCYSFISLYILSILYFIFHVYCYAPRRQSKLFVCVKVLGSKADSDSYNLFPTKDMTAREVICFNYWSHEVRVQKS